jgi:hypothetical protein
MQKQWKQQQPKQSKQSKQQLQKQSNKTMLKTMGPPTNVSRTGSSHNGI